MSYVFFLSILWQKFVNFIHLFKKSPALCFTDFSLFSLLLIFCSYLYISSLLFALGFFWSSFSRFLKWELRCWFWNFPFYLMHALIAIHFPFPNCFRSILICCILIFIQFHSFFKIFLETSSLTHGLFKSMLFGFQVFGDFPFIFCCWFLIWCNCGQGTYSALFQFLKITEICFMVQDVVSVGTHSVGTWKACVFYCCWVEHKCLLDLVGWWCCWVLLYSISLLIFLSRSIKPTVTVRDFNTQLWIFLFLLSLLPVFALHIL